MDFGVKRTFASNENGGGPLVLVVRLELKPNASTRARINALVERDETYVLRTCACVHACVCACVMRNRADGDIDRLFGSIVDYQFDQDKSEDLRWEEIRCRRTRAEHPETPRIESGSAETYVPKGRSTLSTSANTRCVSHRGDHARENETTRWP